MALTQRLQIRQSQALVMTPQLMQAIKLLQLSNLDLVTYVEAELERNPLLDRNSEEDPPANPNDKQAEHTDREALNGPGPQSGAEGASSQSEQSDSPLDDTPSDDAEPMRPRTSELPAGYS